jgi:hypothetical protein
MTDWSNHEYNSEGRYVSWNNSSHAIASASQNALNGTFEPSAREVVGGHNPGSGMIMADSKDDSLVIHARMKRNLVEGTSSFLNPLALSCHLGCKSIGRPLS